MTLADEDTNSIQTDNANREIQGNVAMQVARPGSQLWKQCKWRHLINKFSTNPSCAKFATNASGAIWWANLVQVTESISGSVVPLAMFFNKVLDFEQK